MQRKDWQEFVPKSYLYLRHKYNWDTFKKDLIAGLTVGVVALPLAMAFAIASGVPPERGIVTAIIAGFLISALGGSRVQVGGPTGAFVVLIYGIVQRNGYEGLAICTIIAGAMMIAMGVFRLGSWIKYVPYPLITGFTTGIAVIIFSSQIKEFFGLNMRQVPADFIEKWKAYFEAMPTFNGPTLAMGCGSLGLILLLRRFFPRIPWGIATIILATIVYVALDLPVQTIETRFGDLPRTLPLPSIPSLLFPTAKFQEYFFDGLAIAFLGSIEALLSAVVADGMIGGRHKSNCELVGQGIANLASVLFGGIPATGAIARTAANVKTGAQTPMAGMIHAVTLFLIIFLMAPIVSKIPLAALAAVLIMVAWNMSEAKYFCALLRAPRGDMAILLTAFLLTVFVDITFAIALGMILAMFIFMKRMSELSKTIQLTALFRENGAEFPERSDPEAISKKNVPHHVEVYEINGPFFFGAADMLQDVLSNLQTIPKVFILRMRYVPFIDASGMHALREFYHRCQKTHTHLLLSGIHGRLEQELKKFGLDQLIGDQNIFPNINLALARAQRIMFLLDAQIHPKNPSTANDPKRPQP
ncbi:MAG: yvdB [Parachlamydiales bacterium]|nr:yvdB [Parachlamydiales bacterium]